MLPQLHFGSLRYGEADCCGVLIVGCTGDDAADHEVLRPAANGAEAEQQGNAYLKLDGKHVWKNLFLWKK